jgi:hypothetical protein
MSNSDYNKIISTINSVTQDYTYTPDPNNLICIDTSNNRIGINTIDPSCALHISGGDIQVNNIYSNIISAQNYGVVNATIVNASNLLDISVGLIHANTIYGSVAKINANANASSDIITIDISNSTGVNIKTGDTCGNALTINGVRVATTQHITNAIPYGVIVAYYSSTNIPNGWALCNGSNNTPDLRGRFILGSNPINPTGGIIQMDATYIYNIFLTVGPSIFTPPFDTTVDVLIVGGGGGGNSNAFGGRGGAVQRVDNVVVSETSTYDIVVGNGGEPNTTGGDSSAFNNIAKGGVSSDGVGQYGIQNDILGRNYYWGGSGSSVNTNGGLGGGGAGYGGIGGAGYNIGGAGTIGGGNGGANTGGGGGGYALGPGSGGSGIVVIRYLQARNGLSLNIVNASGGEENVSSFTTSTSTSNNTVLSTTIDLTVPTFNNMPPYYVLVYIMKISTDFSYNTIPTLPSAPVFSIRQIPTNSVKITWTEPINIGNSVITGYKIYSNNLLESTQIGSSREYTVSNLITGITYNFTLTALNSAGESKSMPKQTIQIT